MLARLKEVVAALGVSRTKFGAGLGLDSAYISRVLNGKQRLSDSMIARIVLRYGVNENWLRNGEGEMFSQTKQPVAEPSILEYEASVEEFVEAASKLPRELQELLIKIGAGLSAKNGFPPLGYRPNGSVDRGNSQQD